MTTLLCNQSEQGVPSCTNFVVTKSFDVVSGAMVSARSDHMNSIVIELHTLKSAVSSKARGIQRKGESLGDSPALPERATVSK